MNAGFDIRQMKAVDIPEANALANRAFYELFKSLGRQVPEQFFPELMFPTRFQTDPQGCLVAEDTGGSGALLGVVLSVANGALGWFGPLATAVDRQNAGVGRALTLACVDQWRARGVRLMGLDTLGISSKHAHLYSRCGFRPGWVSATFSCDVRQLKAPGGVERDADQPDLQYIYPGLDLSRQVAVIRANRIGMTFTAGQGFAVLHTAATMADAETGYLPFVAAPDRRTFDLLLQAAEAECAARGLIKMLTYTPGTSFPAMDALTEHGYRIGSTFLRMKRGERLDYDSTNAFCCDSWL